MQKLTLRKHLGRFTEADEREYAEASAKGIFNLPETPDPDDDIDVDTGTEPVDSIHEGLVDHDATSVRIVTSTPTCDVTVWIVLDEHDEEIVRFDSRGGYTQRDAETFVDEYNEAHRPMKCRSCGHVPCASWCGADERS